MMAEMLNGNPFSWSQPSTWPWIVYVWLVVIVASQLKPLWNWLARYRARRWPVTEGRIESVAVAEPKGSLSSWLSSKNRVSEFVANLGYSYRVEGDLYNGEYKRKFESEEEAREFIRDLQGKPVIIHYKSNKPIVSDLSESSLETVLQTRGPGPAADSLAGASARSVPDWLRPFLWVFVCISAIGLVVSLWVHVGALMGRRVAPEEYFVILHLGIFVVWFPSVLVAQRRVGNTRRKDIWKLILKGSPDWMRYMVYGFFAYAMVNFLLFLSKTPENGSGMNPPAVVWRGFSGHWMAFYSAALAILYSAAREAADSARCINGHAVSPGADFCERCGQPLAHPR